MGPHSQPVPLQAPPTFRTNPEDIIAAAESTVAESERLHAQLVANITTKTANFESVVLPLAQAENTLLLEKRRLVFHRSVSPNPEVREASICAQSLFDAFSIRTTMNEGIYKLLLAVQEKREVLEPECAYLLERMIRDHVRSGLSLPKGPRRDRFGDIQHRLSYIKTRFGENIGQLQDGIWLSHRELAGLDQSFLHRLPIGTAENEGNVKVTFQENVVGRVLSSVDDPRVRKRIYVANANRCDENVGLFQEAVTLRDEASHLLGYPNHATFILEDRMAKSPGIVHSYLNELLSLLGPSGRQEISDLGDAKKAHLESLGQSAEGKFFPWDDYYYKQRRDVNQRRLVKGRPSEYFPLETTLSGVLGIFSELFGLVFLPLTDEDMKKAFPSGHSMEACWCDEVTAFAVWDSEKLGGAFIGYLYLDLIERDGKLQTPCAFNIEPVCIASRVIFMHLVDVYQGFTLADGSRHHPVVALTSSLQRPTATKPTLLRQPELVLLVHELGHGIHDLVSKTKYARFHGPDGTSIDFGEAPSQLLERWCWMPSVLKSLSRHYAHLSPAYMDAWKESNKGHSSPPKTIPQDLVERLVAGKQHQGALFHLNQLHWCVFDMAVHEPEKHGLFESVSIAALFKKLRREIYPTDCDESLGDEWDHGYVSFNHAMGEYGAGYYSYLL
ncbi:Saccharolysin [Cladobotryum mycophilum]|uniref:Saccharolysin n=1 Tax=Cladobotryum mycophilum TaxID=491253 RepID=A0ABR0SB42_9HYPO